MSFEPTTAEDIAAACADLRTRGEFPAAIARGLAGDDPDKMRAAVTHLIDAGRVDGLRPLVERFRNKADFGVWARVTSSRLHQLSGEFEAGLGDIDDLMQRFSPRAGPHWFVARARCLQGLGRWDEAEAAVRLGGERFPDVALPKVFLANLLSRRDRPADALEVWRDLHAKFAEPELDWFVSLSNVLRALDRREDALETLEACGRRFPDDRRTPPLLAQVAEARSQWARALDLWQGYAAPDEPQAVVGRARALFRLDRIDEALAALDGFLARKPDNIPALRERAHIAMELGEVAPARDDLTRLTERSADLSRPEWWASLARAQHDLRDYAAGAAALAELERRFPASALAELERLRLIKELERGQDDIAVLVEAALKRFPDDPELRGHWVWLLLGFGRLAEAEAAVLALEADGAGPALISRLRLEADQRDDASLRAYVEEAVADRDWTASDAIQIGDFLLMLRAVWAVERGCALLESLSERFPGHLRLRVIHIRLLVGRGDNEAALALIDALSARYRRREVLELRAFAEVQRGRDESAQAIWRETLATNYFPAVHCPIERLERISPDDRPPPGEGVSAYIVFRNEAAQIPGFLAHHRRLGVRRFVFFDHLSTDESRALLLNEPDVILYDCPDSYQFSWSGRRWVNEIVAREGAKGWGLQADVDEYLVYPGCETVGLDAFVGYLDARGYQGVAGYMLDLFPRRLIDEAGEPSPLSAYRFYDDDYKPIWQERPPYAHPTGGVRARLFQAKEYLHKTPLWRLDAGLLINSHETTHLKFADVSAALLHYKMMNVVLRGRHAEAELAGAAYLEADSAVDAMRRHSRYAARLAPLWRADLVKPGVSRELEDSLAMAQRGLMQASPRYLDWLRR